MKFMHLSDLHLGIRVNGFSMLEDQSYILNQIIEYIDSERVDAVIIAGDIYDKAIPPVEAVLLFDRFLNAVIDRNCTVLAVSGNHDSPERLAYGQRLLARGGVHMAALYDGRISRVRLNDSDGAVDCYLLPFIKPSQVRAALGITDELDYTSAVSAALNAVVRDPGVRSVLVTHQFVTGASRTDSERISVGGTDNVDASVFSGFDYVALGHIHRAQHIGTQRLRYCGTPLKYSFSEASDSKSATLVEMDAEGDVHIRELPLQPLRDVRVLRGQFQAIVTQAENDVCREDYMRIILTDEDEISEVLGRLRRLYPNIMRVEYDNRRTESGTASLEPARLEEQSPEALFAAFYEVQNNQPMTGEQESYMHELIERLWEERL